MGKVFIVTGTMPDIIKMAPLVWEGEKRGHEVILVHSHQHTSDVLVKNHYRAIGLRPPDIVFDNFETFEENFKRYLGVFNDVSLVLVHGDTNTARKGAVAAHFQNIPVGHVEAGLRTRTREPWPEQTNTRIVDACSNIFFAATPENVDSLLDEGFNKKDIYLTGNTVVDMVKKFVTEPYIRPTNGKIWVCIHREENLRHSSRMDDIIRFINELAETKDVHFVDRQRTSNIPLSSKVKRTQPMPYPEALNFMMNCELVITDSGSIQEETCTLKIPTITVRNRTDRPESLGYNNLLGGVTYNSLNAAMNLVKTLDSSFTYNIFGDGFSSKYIWNAIEEKNNKFIRWTDVIR